MTDEILKKKQEEMKARHRSKRAQDRARRLLKEAAGGPSAIVEVIPADTKPVTDAKNILGRMKEALKTLNSLTPEQIQERIGQMMNLLNLKLQLQVNDYLDKLSSSDPDVKKNALKMVETLMPFITQIAELNMKMQIALGINESRQRTITPQRQPIAALPASAGDWEKNFGDTLKNRSLN